ncbi:hypothetical protein [Marinicella rhabdoformis]|uniref:hypothetical protein n=1 Tax=Marinicella rhabdoformis TaxID=2580566 RepID=UPI0012AEDBDD|nr:hypothetical protein [Marinicella rhabdoformis]
MNKAHKKSFNQHAFMSCIMASFLGALLFPFWMMVWGLIMGESVFVIDPTVIFSYLLSAGMAFFFGTILILVIGWPTLLILNQYKINHPMIASLSGFVIMLIIWLTLYSGSLNFRALFAGLLLCMNGATFGFFASYFSRNRT